MSDKLNGPVLDEEAEATPGFGKDLGTIIDRANSDALPEDVVWFNVRMVKVLGDDPLSDSRFRGTRTVYTDDGEVVGFFVMKAGGYAKVFLAKDSKPFGLHVSSGQEFYLTLQCLMDAKHPHGWIVMIVSEVPMNKTSVKVMA